MAERPPAGALRVAVVVAAPAVPPWVAWAVDRIGAAPELDLCAALVADPADRARPAGMLFHRGDALIRPGQDCTRRYGEAVVWNRVGRPPRVRRRLSSRAPAHTAALRRISSAAAVSR